jgi:putative hydrolase of the HAD superfamily
MTQLPRAMLIDMDDTILSAYGRPEIAWNKIASEFAGEFAPLSSQKVACAIVDAAHQFWATAEPAWRLKLAEARHVVVRNGFAALAAAHQTTLSMDLAARLADRFTVYRDEEMFVFPGAHDAIDALKARGVKLALVTNGAADIQRAKVERFALTHRFDHIQIEGEHGFGKPEEGAGRHGSRNLDGRGQSGMGSRGAAAPRHLCNLDRCPRRWPAGGIHRQARSHHPLADRVAACRIADRASLF